MKPNPFDGLRDARVAGDFARSLPPEFSQAGGFRTLAARAPLLVLPGVALALRAQLPAWGFMWAMALAIFIDCKWLSWRRSGVKAVRPWRIWAYFFLWPGLDAKAFLGSGVPMRCERQGGASFASWFAAAAKTLVGAALLWGMARRMPASSPLWAGWCGLLGLAFLLHFGAFHLLSLGWQRAGIDARPLMRAPILATSLGDFWGRRWNSAFSTLAHDLAFRCAGRRLGATATTTLVFLASGLVHELVISLPARGGYGLPTLYFLAQSAGMLAERSVLGRKLGLRRGLRGWLFTAAFTAGPAFWLFHPPFIRRVIIPFLHAIGAL